MGDESFRPFGLCAILEPLAEGMHEEAIAQTLHFGNFAEGDCAWGEGAGLIARNETGVFCPERVRGRQLS